MVRMAMKQRLPKDPLKAAAQLPGTSKTTRLRKLVCSDGCGYPPLRVSRAAIDAGLPVCVCGAVFWPWDLDDVGRAHAAGHLTDGQYAAHPLVQAYELECSSIAQGQSGHRAGELSDPTAGAAWRVAVAVAQGNLSNKLTAARAARVTEPMPF